MWTLTNGRALGSHQTSIGPTSMSRVGLETNIPRQKINKRSAFQRVTRYCAMETHTPESLCAFLIPLDGGMRTAALLSGSLYLFSEQVKGGQVHTFTGVPCYSRLKEMRVVAVQLWCCWFQRLHAASVSLNYHGRSLFFRGTLMMVARPRLVGFLLLWSRDFGVQGVVRFGTMETQTYTESLYGSRASRNGCVQCCEP